MLRQYIIRSENINFNDYRLVPRVMELISGSGLELLENIIETYYIDTHKMGNGHIELWSNPIGIINRIRVDNIKIIPPNITDIWIRYSSSSSEPSIISE